MVAAQEKEAIAPPKPEWCSLIYIPGIESDKRSEVQKARGVRSNIQAPVMRHFSYMPPMPKNHREGTPAPVRTFHVHGGTNLGIHYRANGEELIERLPIADWQLVAVQPVNAHLLKIGAIRVIYPESPDDFGEPGYRHFSLEDAIELVQFHMHVSWVDRALIGENRSAVLTAANQRKTEILAEELALQTGGY